MATVRYVNLERGLVSVTGTDRQSFLQGLISQDVDRISRLILDGEQGRADELIGRITRFKLRAQVDLAVADDLTVLAVFGQDAPAALDLLGDPGAARPLAGGIAFVDPRSAELGCRLILPAADSAAVTADLAIDEAPFEAYDTLRIGLGIPDGRRDMDVEKSSLLECNFDAPGTAISVNGKQIGEIRSIHDGLALASLRLDALGGADDRRPLTAGGAVVSLILPQSRD
jgi:folate-binding Fe-S cluster repair protein YgfZ